MPRSSRPQARLLTPAASHDLPAGKAISLPVVKVVTVNLEWDKAANTDQIERLSQVLIKPSNALTGGLCPRPGRVTNEKYDWYLSSYLPVTPSDRDAKIAEDDLSASQMLRLFVELGDLIGDGFDL